MKLRSFRLRLALWSAALAGLALLGFASAVDWQLGHDKLAALDRELRLYVEREASHPIPPPDYWQQIELALNNLFARSVNDAVLLMVLDNEGIYYQSAQWPAELDSRHLPWTEPEPDFARPPPPRANEFEDDFNSRPPPPPPAHATLSQISTAKAQWRFALSTTPFMRLAVGVNLSVIDAEMATMRQAFLFAIPLALLLIGIGSALLSAQALAPLKRLTTTMQQVTAKGLHQRLILGDEDREFSQLMQVFNDMLERLQRSFMQASRFSADAAHELKTPLAILQGQIEQAMSQVEAGSAVQIRLSSILDEVQRLSTISRKLLLLSLADAGRLRLQKSNVNLTHLLNDLIEDAQMLAPHLQVSGNITPNLFIQADTALIQQVLHNLISNAIKYNIAQTNTSQGYIIIKAYAQQNHIKVAMTNSSLDVLNLDKKRLFERFYRADPAHGRQIEGVGLGLSLSREIVLAHGGNLLLEKINQHEVTFVLVF